MHQYYIYSNLKIEFKPYGIENEKQIPKKKKKGGPILFFPKFVRWVDWNHPEEELPKLSYSSKSKTEHLNSKTAILWQDPKSYGLNMAISTLFLSQNMRTLCHFLNSILFCHQVAKFRPQKKKKKVVGARCELFSVSQSIG
jgi:hypothetical protein